jgi:hypothetical protein
VELDVTALSGDYYFRKRGPSAALVRSAIVGRKPSQIAAGRVRARANDDVYVCLTYTILRTDKKQLLGSGQYRER